MNTILIIVLVLALLGGAVYVGTKFFGLTEDEDNDGIPDVVEDKVAAAKSAVKKTTKEVKRRAKRVKEEAGDVVDAVKDAANQAGDIVDAVKGNPRKGRRPSRKGTPKSKGTVNRSQGGGSDYYTKKR